MDKNEQCEMNRVQAIEIAVLYVPLVQRFSNCGARPTGGE